jgi:C-terminal processing protease CtpA/Prc
LSGDKIINVGDSTVAGKKITNERIINLMRGEIGSKVKIGVLRGREKKIRQFIVSRQEIPVNSIDAAYPLNDRIGYIKISKFSASTSKDFMDVYILCFLPKLHELTSQEFSLCFDISVEIVRQKQMIGRRYSTFIIACVDCSILLKYSKIVLYH